MSFACKLRATMDGERGFCLESDLQDHSRTQIWEHDRLESFSETMR